MSIELLSPAKDLECGINAIKYGADAVYIGGPHFGARKEASNSLEDIATLVKYAHFYNAKVYVTINTIIFNSELDKVEELINALSKIQIDAIIIQDLGIFALNIPNIDIFISTQATNISPEKVKFLEDLGAKRVILERALSLAEIQEIRQTTKVELETFVHGAICVCYSGECNMSYEAGGRSANRGECAQPCRKQYSLLDSKGKVLKQSSKLLSVKDLNLAENLEELIDAGITSFKIEGRLKDVNYVRNVTAYYRKKLDLVLEKKGLYKASSGSIQHDFEPNLNKTFNRGYTEYFLNTKHKVNSELSFNVGEYVGVVDRIMGDKLWVDTAIELRNGDGIVYLDGYEQQGFFVNNFANNQLTANKPLDITYGTALFRNYDAKFIDQLNKSKTERKILIEFDLREADGEYVLQVQDGDGNSLVKTSRLKDKIESFATDYESRITETLNKLGNTSFICETVSLQLDKQHFIPLSSLKRTRNELLAELTKTREEKVPVRNTRKEPIINNVPEILVANAKTEKLFGKKKNVVELGYNEGAPLMRTRYCVLHELGMCLKKKKLAQPLYLKDEKNTFELQFDCIKCEMIVKR
ncbi:MAG: U32 family peptidase [Candidatus Margulisbacteria bacterium]|nr:U32 family peptidase [Candidatus Margulisiibacteriota bacterium]